MKYIIALCVLFGSIDTIAQSDEQIIKTLLSDFLVNVESKEMHDRFWAKELVYTSSTGSKFGKKEIMEGFEAETNEEAPSPEYTAEEVKVLVYGKVASLVFKLIAVNPDGSRMEYYNSGTFQKQKGEWKAIVWQATKIPETN